MCFCSVHLMWVFNDTAADDDAADVAAAVDALEAAVATSLPQLLYCCC